MNTDIFADEFTKRSDRLNWYANWFLVGSILMLGSGIPAIVYAPSLTFSDIKNSGQAYDERANKAQLAQKRTTDEIALLDEPIAEQVRQCITVSKEYFRAWPDMPDRSGNGSYAYAEKSATIDGGVAPIELINPTQQAAKQIQNRRRDYSYPEPTDIYLRLCGSPFGIELRKSNQDLDDITKTLASKPIGFDPTILNNLLTKRYDLEKAEDSHRRVVKAILDAKAQAEARGGADDSGQDVSARLLQTSITRFGLLAIIGFFVGVMVSLYRYNVRLAGFYLARADFFRMFGDSQLSPNEAAVVLQALTPTVEFGKSPVSPASQVAELLRGAKEK